MQKNTNSPSLILKIDFLKVPPHYCVLELQAPQPAQTILQSESVVERPYEPYLLPQPQLDLLKIKLI